MHNFTELIFLFALALLVVYWWRISELKSFALRKARDYCHKRSIQLLDQTLAFKGYRFIRDQRHKARLCRVYAFDFSADGEHREHGEIAVTGFRVLNVLLASEHLEITPY